MEANIDNIEINATAANETDSYLDMMAHAEAFAKYCPEAASLIYVGTTGVYGGYITDMIILFEALELILIRIASVIKALSELALTYKDFPIVGHLRPIGVVKPVELNTIGRLCCSWIKYLTPYESYFRYYKNSQRFSSIIGRPGIRDSLLKIFNGDSGKIEQFDLRVRQLAGFDFTCRSTYDYTYNFLLQAFGRIGLSVEKIIKDFRKLVLLREFDEPFETTRHGSSEISGSDRCFALANHMKILDSYSEVQNRNAVLWMEETFDNTINRSLFVPESFFCADACLLTLLNISQGLIVYPKVVKRHVEEELPFIATSDIIIAMRISGHLTQNCLEKIHEIAQEEIAHENGNDVLERFRTDSYFEPIFDQMNHILDAKRFTKGFAEQVEQYVGNIVKPIIAEYGLEIKNLSVDPKKVTAQYCTITDRYV